jgi:hypothetical protein
MQRRKYLAALGSLAAGGAAAMGTGAFTSARVNRSVSVNVANDANAYIGFDATKGENSNFAEYSSRQIDISLDGDGVDGAGVNENSDYSILELFEVIHQGTEPAFFYVDPTSVTINGNSVPDNTTDYIDPQATNLPAKSDFGGSLTGVYIPSSGDAATVASEFNTIFDSYNSNDDNGGDLFVVEPGESFYFGLSLKENDGNGFGDVEMTLRADTNVVDDGIVQ